MARKFSKNYRKTSRHRTRRYRRGRGSRRHSRRSMHGGFGFYVSDADKQRMAKAKGAVSGAFQNLRSSASDALGRARTGASGAVGNVRQRYGAWQTERKLNRAVDALEAINRANRRASLRSAIQSGVVGGGRKRRGSKHRGSKRRRSSKR